MSKRAEDAAFKAYPDYPSMDGGYITQRKQRHCYIQGYEQAEKDTIERAWKWMTSAQGEHTFEDFRKAMEEE